MKRLRLATGNAGKLREVREVLEPLGFEVLDLAGLGVGDIAETGDTFAANAEIKALAIAAVVPGEVVLADDSGLLVDGLGGQPGVHSARYAGVEGKDRDARNCDKLMQELARLPNASRRARFLCVMCLKEPGQAPRFFEGAVHGKIISTPRGGGGFGYDPLFVPEGFEATMAELAAEQKNAISHRGRALAALVAELRARR